MKYFAITVLAGTSLYGNLSTAKAPEDFTCLTYQLRQASAELSGQKPTLEEWVKRVVKVENSRLFFHKLSKAEQDKIANFHLTTISSDPTKKSELAKFVDYICATDLSDRERNWLAEQLRRNSDN